MFHDVASKTTPTSDLWHDALSHTLEKFQLSVLKHKGQKKIGQVVAIIATVLSYCHYLFTSDSRTCEIKSNELGYVKKNKTYSH